jgi:hypothetical protein
MKKTITFFVILLSLVSEGSWAQTGTTNVKAIPKQGAPLFLTDSVTGLHNGNSRNFQLQDILNLEGPRVKTYTNTTMSGASNNFLLIPATAITGFDGSHRWLTDGQSAVWDAYGTGKQDVLISGTTIKTINSQSLLGSGNIVISGSGGLADPGSNGIIKRTSLNTTVAATAGTDYQAPLVSGTSLKTINGTSLLGSGDITITGGGGGGSVGYSDLAYSSTVNVDFSGNNLNLTGVSGNFTLTATNASAGANRVITINKTTASPITISIDPSTLAGAVVLKPYTNTVIENDAASPPTLTVNGASGAIYRLYIEMVKTAAGVKPEIMVSTFASENAINVTANFNTVSVPNNFGIIPHSTNTTAETILATVPILANAFGAGTYMKIFYTISTNTDGGAANGGNLQFRVRMGTSGLSSPMVGSYAQNTNGLTYAYSDHREERVNFTTTTSARVFPDWDHTTNPVPASVVSANTTATFNLYFTAQKTVGTDQAEISDIIIEAGNK